MLMSGIRIGNLIRQNRLLKDALPYRVSQDDNGNKVLSYGVGFAGYDIRLGTDFVIFGNIAMYTEDKAEMDAPVVTFDYKEELATMKWYPGVDPKRLYNENDAQFSYWRTFSTDKPFYIGGNIFILGESVETFEMEPNVIGLCFGKSTYARSGVLVNVTPIEPGWRGKLVIEIANLGRLPVKIYPGEGIAQVVFAYVDGDNQSYNGRWQNQEPISRVASRCLPVKIRT